MDKLNKIENAKGVDRTDKSKTLARRQRSLKSQDAFIKALMSARAWTRFRISMSLSMRQLNCASHVRVVMRDNAVFGPIGEAVYL